MIGLFSSSTEDIVRKVFIEIIGLSLLNRAYDRIEEEILHRYATEYNLGTESLEEAKGWVEKMNILYQEVAYLI